MAKILVFTESSGESVKNVSLEIMGKLTGHNIDAVVFNQLGDEGKTQLAKYGAENIHLLSADHLKSYSSEGWSLALKELIEKENYQYVLAGSTSLGKDLFPRLATKFNSGMISEVVNFNFEGDNFKGTRPLFAGKILAKVELKGDAPHFVTVRPNALGMPETESSASGNIQESNPSACDMKAIVKEIIKGASEKLDLTEANIIVSGGRAMKEEANFKILNEMADVIGATVGASRAAVDSGYAASSMQVGQTGKTVSPTLYIACGISGAIQHLAGMRTSKVIVAINTDPDAPIFNYADYGIVGDLFKVVPVLTEEFKKIL